MISRRATPIFRIVNTTYNTNLCTPASLGFATILLVSADHGCLRYSKALTNYTYDGTGNTTQISKWVSGSYYLNQQYSYNANGTVSDSPPTPMVL